MPVTLDALRRFIPADSPLGRAGGADLLVRATGGNLTGAAALAAIARKESEFGRTSGRFKNNAWGWGVHLGPDVNTAPDYETMAKRVWTGLTGDLYKGAGYRTLPKIISRYAPPSENNTALYQRQMGEWLTSLGLSPNTDIFEGGQTAAPGALRMRPNGPAARASGQSANRTAQEAKQNALAALGPKPSLGANMVQALTSGGNQSQALMEASSRYLGQKKERKAAETEIVKAVATAAQRSGASKPPPASREEGAALTAAGDDGVVKAALEQVGVDYSWGGGSTSGPTRGFAQGANTVGFDCSSLVQYAWAKAGVNLPRTTYDQIKVGKGVNAKKMSSWKPGDLLFPHSGHVLMYIGNGKAIHAPQTGQKVQVVDADYRPMKVVRRPA